MKRKKAKQKTAGIINAFKDQPLPMPGLLCLIMYAISLGPEVGGPLMMKTAAMFWPFALITWARMTRRSSTAAFKLGHLFQEPGKDHFRAVMPTQKACQNGDNDSQLDVETSSLYSNPLQPALSVTLALAVYHFAYPPSPVPTDNIWGFSCPDAVFGGKLTELMAVLGEREDFLEFIGAASADQIASHSLRKGKIFLRVGTVHRHVLLIN